MLPRAQRVNSTSTITIITIIITITTITITTITIISITTKNIFTRRKVHKKVIDHRLSSGKGGYFALQGWRLEDFQPQDNSLQGWGGRIYLEDLKQRFFSATNWLAAMSAVGSITSRRCLQVAMIIMICLLAKFQQHSHSQLYWEVIASYVHSSQSSCHPLVIVSSFILCWKLPIIMSSSLAYLFQDSSSFFTCWLRILSLA